VLGHIHIQSGRGNIIDISRSEIKNVGSVHLKKRGMVIQKPDNLTPYGTPPKGEWDAKGKLWESQQRMFIDTPQLDE
jgi:hypothetical protein